MNVKAKIRAIEKKHSKGYKICTTALAEAEEIFKGIEGYQHCQTGQDGSIEVIIGIDGSCGDLPDDYIMTQALEFLEEKS